MNHIHRSIWSEALGAWIAVSEIATGQGKRSSNRRRLLATGLLLCTTPVCALPTGEQLVAGQATVNTPNAGQMQINQSSQNAIINWQGFSIAPTEAVNIQQPNAQAALLNRVVGQDASQIQGQLNANGQVYLVNPNGVLFSKTAQVDVGGLVASTHNISNADFMADKNHFTQDGGQGTVENHGTINVPNGGVVALIGDSVTNTGTINTPKGTTALAAGKTVDLDFKGDGLVEVKVSEAALNAQITNRGAIQADGGRVVLTAKAANSLIDTVINQQGIIKAHGLVERNGEIILEGGYVAQTGTLDVSGNTGGKVDINARAILDSGKTNADGTAGNGGIINLKASDAIIQTAAADTHANGTTTGGTVHLEAINSVFSSGKLSSKGDTGGTIDVVSSDRVVLAAADVDASGTQQGGLVRVGGDFHGANAKLPNAKTTIINGSSKLKADGGKGQVVVWSNQQTDYDGSISANKAGDIEVSSKGLLNYAGRADAGGGGSLLLDPKNIVISANAGVANYALIDPHAAAGNLFGTKTTVLGTTVGGLFTENGNVAVSSSGDDFAATNAGAAYLFNTTTGALLAMLTGASANDQVSGGIDGITALSNGNYVVGSTNWANGGILNAGAATWGNGLTGISGTVSAANSVVGSTANDAVGSYGINALSNGNYVVMSANWDNGAIVDAGAATWGNGLTGISGTISAANSLVGANTSDFVSDRGIIVLTNGNYVVRSGLWDNGTILNAGAATWGNGSTGISGTITALNSLIGSSVGDTVGSSVTALSNGNYVVSSSGWDNGAIVDAGAATWGNGSTGVSGTITALNSLIGVNAGDTISNSGITALSNGNYVVGSANWDNGTIANVGAATWGNGLLGISGTIGLANSLIGVNANDFVSNWGITALTNGNYVVRSGSWANGAILNAGAATWGNGSTGINGTITALNSLIGSTAGDAVAGFSGVTALTNGNYVVGSPNWDNGNIANVGAATWGNGNTGISGTINAANSLIGSTAGDAVSSNGITALSNGNYVVRSSLWDNGVILNAGAATWGNGNTGINGTVSAINSLVGSTAGDSVGNGDIAALSNGNYVVRSSNWANGALLNAGAATWGNGNTGSSGAISAANSLVGSTAGDAVSNGGITALVNGNYVVSSINWANVGAATWGNGNTGISGLVSATNSLTGSAAFDWSGATNTPFNYGVKGLSNGNYVVHSGTWDNAGLVDAGQVRIGTPADILFGYGVGQTMIFNPSTLADTLALGTNVNLQASNDITLDVGTNINVSGRKGGTLTLQAGRNITLNSSINTANGDFTAIAGDPNAIPSDRDAGTPTITLGSGATINTGAGKVILAAIGGDFVNNTDSTTPITASQWLIYSTDPRQNTLNGMVADYKRYGQSYTGTPVADTTTGRNDDDNGEHDTDSTPHDVRTGNWFFYSITPVLTVTPNSQIIPSDTSPANSALTNPADITFTLTGFIDGDTLNTADIEGSAFFDINKVTSNTELYNVAYLKGLASNLGYVFVDNNNSINELKVTPSNPLVKGVFSKDIQINVEQWFSQLSILQSLTTFHHPNSPKLDTSKNMNLLIRVVSGGLQLHREHLLETIKISPTMSCIRLPMKLQSNNRI